MPKRDRYLFVCTNRRPDGNPKGSCAQSGSEELLAALKAAVVTSKLQASARPCGASCLDVCWEGPVVAIMPDDVFLGRVTKEDIPAIVEALANKEAKVSEHPKLRDKALDRSKFDDPALVQISAKKGS